MGAGARRLKQDEATKEIVVLGLSGHALYALDAKLSEVRRVMAKQVSRNGR